MKLSRFWRDLVFVVFLALGFFFLVVATIDAFRSEYDKATFHLIVGLLLLRGVGSDF